MSLRYCIKCNEACERVMVLTDKQTRDFLSSSTQTQGLVYCINTECSRFGLASILSLTEKITPQPTPKSKPVQSRSQK